MGFVSLSPEELNQHLGKTNSPEVKKAPPSFTMTYRDQMAIAELLVKIDQILNFKKIDNAQTLKLIRLNRRVMGYIRQH